jgi:hypothetical protein
MARVKLSPKVPASLRAVGPPSRSSPTISAMVELASRRHKNAVQGYGPTLDTAALQKGWPPRSQQGRTGSGAGHCSCRRLFFLAPQHEAGPPRARTGDAYGPPEIASKLAQAAGNSPLSAVSGARAVGLWHPAPHHQSGTAPTVEPGEHAAVEPAAAAASDVSGVIYGVAHGSF